MRLQRLEVKGFKSFANETVLHFNDDVIGVVGPNGSGKSNVVDAIRWVLGEQKSKELRLDKMSDIIFNGTKKRKEAGMAQVTLVFDNDKGVLPVEYQQVSISRLLFRSGESEYRLNNIPCRLKDIQSLLLDTGIGSNSYAIIALGMVDDILADKDNARRRMFEQAAGISKYKNRKKQTLSKLKSTSADLDRIEDLLFEIEGNLKALESQARRTQRYLNLKEEYKKLSVQFAILSIHTLKEQYKSVEKALEKEQSDYRNLEASIAGMEADVQKVKADNLDKEQNLSAQQRELAQIVNEIRNLESDKALLQQKIAFKKQSLEGLDRNIQASQLDIESIQKEVRQKKKQLEEEQEREATFIREKEVAQKHYDEVKIEYQAAKNLSDTIAKKIQDLDHQIFEAEKSVAILGNTIENKKQRKSQVKATLEQRKEAYQNSAKELASIEEQLTLKQKEFEASVELKDKREQKLSKEEERLKERKDTYDKVSRKLDSSRNEYDLLKSMIDSFEGFPESIKFLSNHWPKKAPLLSDVLDVDEDFKAIIEQYLEPYLNYFIVGDVGTAAEAIRLLTKSQQGKANFFLLDKMPVQTPTDVMIADCIPASSVIKVEPEYKNLVSFLLKDTFIFNGSMDDFKYLDTYQDYDFLSASGTFVKTKASITGGSIGLFEGKKLGRRQNLEKLEKRIKALDQDKTVLLGDIAKSEDKIQQLKKSVLSGDIDKLRREINLIEQSSLKLQYKADEYQSFKERTEQVTEELKQEVKQIKVEIEVKEKEIAQLKLERQKVEHSDEGDKIDVDSLSQKMAAAADQFNGANVALIRHQNLIQTIQKDYDFKLSRSTEVSQRLEQYNKQRKADKEERALFKEELQKKEEQLVKTYEHRKSFDKALSKAEQDYYAARNLINEKEDQLKALQRNRNQIQAKVQQLRDDFTGLKFKINAVGDRLKIEFDIALNDIINDEPDDSIPADQLEEKVEKLKKRLGNFGEINPLAVEAFNEMKERYDSISSQREDILQAKESLLETIKEIEATATEKFNEAFEKVRENFIEVFRSLFTEEDNCNLILLDPENPLESPIEIIAKPKGKKPVSLSQLSGGEKTLTATALLFALYLLKPAPFCIFDEVDAPLDDANIQKFNRIIKKFSGDSQFIIVTHNKSTMAAVDVLYGVYMQEQGVSGVSAVDFRNYEHEELLEQVG